MKSTGEVLGVAKNFEDALYKGLLASGNKMELEGGVLFTVKDRDKEEALEIARRFRNLGFEVYATAGTQKYFAEHGLEATFVNKLTDEEVADVGDLLDSGEITYMVNTTDKGRQPELDEVKMRRKAVERSVHLLTALDTARALAHSLENGKTISEIELVDMTAI